jgi:hypothetical protein
MIQIADILLKEFTTVYCYTCAYEETEECCDECHRKNMNWSLSEKRALELEKMIREVK